MKPNWRGEKNRSHSAQTALESLISTLEPCDTREVMSANETYLVFDALHHRSALRDHVGGHLLSSLGHGANVKLHKFSFLQAIGFVQHTHDSKGIVGAFRCTLKRCRSEEEVTS